MQLFKLTEMLNGWFVGGFQPTALSTQAVEVAIKSYKAGAKEERHFHRIAREVTLIQSGRVIMNGVEYCAGDIVLIDKMNATDFLALEDSVTVVVKVPGAINDKYFGEPAC